MRRVKDSTYHHYTYRHLMSFFNFSYIQNTAYEQEKLFMELMIVHAT
jgi:hypothetical protein